MEPKKNPKYDVHQKRGVIFNISLIISLLIVIAAFQWTVPVQPEATPKRELRESDALMYVPITRIDTEVPKQRKIQMKMPVIPNFVEAKNTAQLSRSIDLPSLHDSINVVQPTIAVELPAESPEKVFDFVEKMPEHEGGLKSFYKILKDNVKYPMRAKRMGTEGKVHVQFVIDERGELGDFKVLSSIGNGCDEEAIRVLKLTKWEPGKQRGKPVKVRMVLPVHFKLGER